jgi:hypothetical protein
MSIPACAADLRHANHENKNLAKHIGQSQWVTPEGTVVRQKRQQSIAGQWQWKCVARCRPLPASSPLSHCPLIQPPCDRPANDISLSSTSSLLHTSPATTTRARSACTTFHRYIHRPDRSPQSSTADTDTDAGSADRRLASLPRRLTMTMANFSTQPDEGYSEDPLNPLPPSQPFSAKPRDEGLSSLALAPSDGHFPDWLTQHIAGLPTAQKTGMFPLCCFVSLLCHHFPRRTAVRPCHASPARPEPLLVFLPPIVLSLRCSHRSQSSPWLFSATSLPA